jgi:hypothetical protein
MTINEIEEEEKSYHTRRRCLVQVASRSSHDTFDDVGAK